MSGRRESKLSSNVVNHCDKTVLLLANRSSRLVCCLRTWLGIPLLIGLLVLFVHQFVDDTQWKGFLLFPSSRRVLS